ncbi:Uncharacterised protein [Klebsiella pneumoniae]|nr:Uncharacterised protein [Klebsiella pneumoniae]
MHRTAKLGITIATGSVFIVDSEDAGFIAVQRQGFAMLLQIAPRGFKIGESRFRFHETELHQAARRIINVNQGSTGRRTVLEPVMIATINLDQFAAASPAIAWLLNFWRTLLAGNPEPGFYHKPSERFLTKNNTVIFSELFPRQCGAKIGIAFTDDIQGLISQ